MSLGMYLYCLTPANPLPEPEGAGVDGLHPLFAERVGEVAAILSEVSLKDFSGPEARARMEDLAWIGPLALRHEEVILAAMRRSPVLPVRFGTVFSSPEALAAPLRRHADTLSKYFRDMAGNGEWAIKGYVNMRKARSEVVASRLAAEKDRLAGLSPGKRYFMEQKIKGAVDRDVTSRLEGTGADIMRFVRDACLAFTERRLLDREVTGEEDEMFLHGAVLVSDRNVEVLLRMTDEWNARHAGKGLPTPSTSGRSRRSIRRAWSTSPKSRWSLPSAPCSTPRARARTSSICSGAAGRR